MATLNEQFASANEKYQVYQDRYFNELKEILLQLLKKQKKSLQKICDKLQDVYPESHININEEPRGYYIRIIFSENDYKRISTLINICNSWMTRDIDDNGYISGTQLNQEYFDMFKYSRKLNKLKKSIYEKFANMGVLWIN